jgi:hypothetical protein
LASLARWEFHLRKGRAPPGLIATIKLSAAPTTASHNASVAVEVPDRFRSEFGADRFQRHDPRRQRIAIILDDPVKFADQSDFLIICPSLALFLATVPNGHPVLWRTQT